jgi:hypothetical protein
MEHSLMTRLRNLCSDVLPKLSVVVLIIAARRNGADPHSDTEQIVARLLRLQNISVKFSTTTYSPRSDTAILPDGREVRTTSGRRDSSNLFRFLNGRAYYDTQLTPKTLAMVRREGLHDFARQVRSFALDRAEEYDLPPAPGSIGMGVVLAHPLLPEDSCIELALGLRWSRQEGWLTADDVRRGDVSRERDTVILTIHDPRHVIHRWRFDPSRRFALISYASEGLSGLPHVTECSNFKEFAGDMLPTVVQFGKDSARSMRLSNIEYKVDDPQNTPEAYQLRWPAGTEVVEERPKAQPPVRVNDQPKPKAPLGRPPVHVDRPITTP